jgi:hypothetical protein
MVGGEESDKAGAVGWRYDGELQFSPRFSLSELLI